MIIIGNHVVDIYDRKNQRTLIKVNSSVEFQGKAQIGSGSRISVEQNAKLTIGKNFHNTADIKIVVRHARKRQFHKLKFHIKFNAF